MLRNLIFSAGLLLSVFLTSCLTDEVAPNISLRNAAGDTITSDTLTIGLNEILTVVSITEDDQDISTVEYFQGYPNASELPIDYAAPIDLTNRRHEVFVDLSFPDTLYISGEFGTLRVRAEDREGNVSELSKRIRVN